MMGNRKMVFSKTIAESDIHIFAGLVGDFFGVHTNESMAKKTQYGTRIAHGAYIVGVMGAGISRWNPNVVPTTVDVKFRRPIKLGETVTIAIDDQPLQQENITLPVFALNELGEIAVAGEFTCEWRGMGESR